MCLFVNADVRGGRGVDVEIEGSQREREGRGKNTKTHESYRISYLFWFHERLRDPIARL